MQPDKLRIGIVGKHGLAFVAGLRNVPEVEVAAFCERDAQALSEGASKHGIPQAFAEYEPMLDHVDAVVLGTPMHLHGSHSLLACKASKHVLSEVTIAVFLKECWKLLDKVLTSGKTYMMAENYCHLEPNVLMREMVRKGLFGSIHYRYSPFPL